MSTLSHYRDQLVSRRFAGGQVAIGHRLIDSGFAGASIPTRGRRAAESMLVVCDAARRRAALTHHRRVGRGAAALAALLQRRRRDPTPARLFRQ